MQATQTVAAKQPVESITRRHRLSAEEFHRSYVARGLPVLISGMTSEWPALNSWSPEYFGSRAPDLPILIKEYGHGAIKAAKWQMSDYVSFLLEHGASVKADAEAVPYCHDIPIFAMIPGLFEDVTPFPLEYVTPWYRNQWWRYAQFFMGPANSVTPLHFDTLLTHNLFVQLVGRKRFTILAPADARHCGRRGWRWFDVNPEQPDLQRYPDYKYAQPVEVLVNPGDMLYLPPHTLHHVRSLDVSISFNIDFHTTISALKGVMAALQGMPAKSVYYNLLSTMGVVFRLPANVIFPLYKSYLNYVS
jgi:hypothetical protein